MQSNSEVSKPNGIIRLERAGRLSWGIALAASLALGLNAFILVGWVITYADAPIPFAYLLSLLIFLPVVLTYVERAVAARGKQGNDIFSLLQTSGSTSKTFAGGWLLLMGYLGLAALLGRGMGLYLSILIPSWFGVALDARWLALLVILLAALSHLMGISNIGSLKTKLVYGGLVVVLIVISWAWINPPGIRPTTPKEPTGLWGVVAFLAPGLWSIDILLGCRRQMRQPRRAWLPALLFPILLGGLLGAITSTVEGYPHLWTPSLSGPAQLMPHLGSAFLEIALVLAGLIVSFMALSGILTNCLRLIKSMIEQKFFPRGQAVADAQAQPLITLGATMAVVTLLVFLAPTHLVVGLAALGFLWVTALLNGEDTLQPRRRPKRKRAFQLPFYPLFPALAAIITIFVSVALPTPVLLAGGGWLLLGIVYYVIYARRHSHTVREVEPDRPESEYSVMAAITDPYSAVPLLQTAANLAKARDGHLIVLQVLTLSEQLPEKIQALRTQEQLQTIEEYVQRADIKKEVRVVPFVRVSKDIAVGIVDTVREENADLLLLAWEETKRQQVLDHVWERVAGEPGSLRDEDEGKQSKAELTPLLDTIARTVACELVILRGRLPRDIERVLVPFGEGTGATTALKLGEALAKENKGRVVALYVTPDETEAKRDAEPAPLPSLFSDLTAPDGPELHVVQATNVKSGVLKEIHSQDVLLIEAAKPSLLEESVIGPIPVQVAHVHHRSTLLVRPSQRAYYLWLRRTWDALTGIFLALPPAERAEISAQMREAARPSINFFVLITLAATIATLGLIQGSAAVIIGAMLVAPLMSPIASTAMGIVEGDVHLMRVAAEAVLKGVVTAIIVGIVITLAIPAPPPTHEILARTHPNLLDLVVALASGAAAGYALSRREVGAALPGVAIAVALVPPLCVVGYGIAVEQFQIAGGAFLLFSTNVIAIILAASTVFLLLGFRPLPEQQEQFRRGLTISIISLILIAIPLAFLLGVSLSQSERQREQARLQTLQRGVEALLNDALPPDTAHLAEVTIEPVRGNYVVRATIYNYGNLGDTEIANLKDLLNAHMDRPMVLLPTVLDIELPRNGDMPTRPAPPPPPRSP